MQIAPELQLTETIDRIFKKQQSGLVALRKEPVSARKARLEKLRAWIHAHRAEIHQAAYADFRKPAAEVDGTEIFHVLSEIALALSQLNTWTRPRKIDAPITMLGTRSFIQYEPRGVCLIISPWNYPFGLAAGPLVTALAAGNSVFLKPSEHTPHVSAVLRKMVEEVFDESLVAVCEGDAEVAEHLLTLPFDHVFFTGSPGIGKRVMKAAAEHLTSITLELGGKSPTVVTASAVMSDAAKRIAVAKFVNNGQTCVAPDYVLVDETIAPAFIAALTAQVKTLFGDGGDAFETSPSYCRIVNDKHFARLNDLLQDALYHGGQIAFGGKTDKATRYIHPVILTHVPHEARLMQEEIFGPLLPVLTYKNLDDAVRIINAQPKALALYVFTQRNADRDKVLRETSSGAACVNDCAIHFLHHNLPFGGVNNSGIGKSHGHYGFVAFSNEKPVMKQKRGFTSIQVFFPPYTRGKRKLMDWFLKLF